MGKRNNIFFGSIIVGLIVLIGLGIYISRQLEVIPGDFGNVITIWDTTLPTTTHQTSGSPTPPPPPPYYPPEVLRNSVEIVTDITFADLQVVISYPELIISVRARCYVDGNYVYDKNMDNLIQGTYSIRIYKADLGIVEDDSDISVDIRLNYYDENNVHEINDVKDVFVFLFDLEEEPPVFNDPVVISGSIAYQWFEEDLHLNFSVSYHESVTIMKMFFYVDNEMIQTAKGDYLEVTHVGSGLYELTIETAIFPRDVTIDFLLKVFFLNENNEEVSFQISDFQHLVLGEAKNGFDNSWIIIAIVMIISLGILSFVVIKLLQKKRVGIKND